MKWAKIFRKNNKEPQKKRGRRRKIINIVFPVLLLLLAIFSISIFFKLFLSSSTQTARPNKTLTISEPFSGQLYFNDQLGGHIFSQAIIKAVNAAQHKIELVVYSMDSTEIRDALYRAANRGVDVTLIFSDKRKTGIDNILSDMPTKIKKVYISSDWGSMHHKFLLIDRGSASAQMFFGSYNFTSLQEKYDPSFLLQTTRPEIVDIFGEEFDRLNSGIHGTGKLKTAFNPFAANIKYPEGYLEIWFTPETGASSLKQRMAGLIKNSTENIKTMIWDFTDSTLANDLAVAAQRESVTIITDDTNYDSPASAFNLLAAEKIKHRLNNLEIITDAKRNDDLKKYFQLDDLNSFLHQHLLLIDDKIAVFGTNNWSSNGFYNNDESIMISNIQSLVDGFKTSFDFNYQKNK